MVFEKEHIVTDDRADRFCRLKPSAILAMLQDGAGCQCAEWGMDWETLAAKGVFWAVTRNRVEIHRLPLVGEKVTIRTWPVTPTRSAYPRAMEGYDAEGNLLFQVMSLWVLMDINKRTMVLPGRSPIQVPGITRGCELPLPTSLAPVAEGEESCRRVVFSELDRNGHMSNIRYLDWMMDQLPAEYHQAHPLKSFTVAYLSEAREGDTITLRCRREDDQLHLEATRPTGQGEKHQRVFAVSSAFC